MNKSIGAIEMASISRGIFVADEMIKKAEVEILYFRSTCPGKFLLIIAGDEGEIDTAIDYGVSIAGKTLFDSFKVHAISPSIIEGIKGKYEEFEPGAIGIVETKKICTGIKAMDIVLKAANVTLMKVMMAFTIGGKLVFMVNGAVSSVEYGLSQVRELLSDSEWENTVIIPSPDSNVRNQLLKR